MKPTFSFFLLLIVLAPLRINAQDITGRWYSEDSSRVYTVYKKKDHYEAVLTSSSRKEDIRGSVILDSVTSRRRKNKYAGAIHSPDNTTLTNVRLCFRRSETDTLCLKLRRMFFFPVKIYWHKESNSTAP